jgi:hypothetical protein
MSSGSTHGHKQEENLNYEALESRRTDHSTGMLVGVAARIR